MCVISLFLALSMTTAGVANDARPAIVDAPPTEIKWRLATGDPPEHVAEVTDALIRHADAAENELEELDRRLLAANWILARQIRPMATRLLLKAPQPSDASEASAFLRVAAAQLDQAGAVFDQLAAAEALIAEQRRDRSDSLQGLRAFLAAFEAIWATNAADGDREARYREAASGLAIVREDWRAGVAAAATLWQAYLFGESNQLDRAMDSLPAVMLDPPDRGEAGLYVRLLRCRYIVRDTRGYAAAVALLARIEQRCTRWIDDRAKQFQAQRTAAWVRRQILLDWANDLRTAGESERAAWCDRAIADIVREHFDENGEVELLPLENAAPPFVPLTDAATILERSTPPEAEVDESPAAPEDVSTIGTNGPEPIDEPTGSRTMPPS